MTAEEIRAEVERLQNEIVELKAEIYDRERAVEVLEAALQKAQGIQL